MVIKALVTKKGMAAGHILKNFDWAPIYLHSVVNIYIVYIEIQLRNLRVGAQYIFLYTESE